jgi:intracellular sulfur oxidation DsrE/DsrF family protein
VDNPNFALLKALTDAGVQVIVCGQSLVRQKIAREQLPPFVKVSTSATIARAVLHAQGYANFAP